MRTYYLSKFIGDGYSLDTAYKPAVAIAAQSWGFIDFRTDQRCRSGWCIAFVDGEPLAEEPGFTLLADAQFLSLGTSLSNDLPNHLLERLKAALDTDFVSTNLTDIVTELLLLDWGFRPATDGVYRVYLGGLIKELSAEEALEFLADRLPDSDDECPRPATTDVSAIRRSASTALDTIARFASHDSPDWIKQALQAPDADNHPLLKHLRSAAEALSQDDDMVHRSHSVVWVQLLARDLQAMTGLLDPKRTAERLRDPEDCEEFRYELFVMAGYRNAGAGITITDSEDAKLGEGIVKWGDETAFVECKRKTLEAITRRDVRSWFHRGTEMLYEKMDQLGAPAHVYITLRTDPTEEKLLWIGDAVTRILQQSLSESVTDRKGWQIEITVHPSNTGSEDSGEAVYCPAGFEFATSEGRMSVGEDEKARSGGSRSVAWRSQEPTDWLKSAKASVKKAARQIPSDGPGVVYVQVPTGKFSVVRLRMQILAHAVEAMLQNDHSRVNVVVVTGIAERYRTDDASVAQITYLYKPVENPKPRTPLSEQFRILGRDFTRRP